MKRYADTYLFFTCMSCIIFIQACNNIPSAIPFPDRETEFSQPVSIPYTLSEPKKIIWESRNPDSIKPATETKVDFNKLPSKPFDIGDFHPLIKPMEETKFNLGNLPDTVFDLNNIPSQKFTFTVSFLGEPARIKALRPHIRAKASETIYEYGLDQGLSTGGAIGPMLQDRRGFLWIGTSNGLYRFDGENFDLYSAAQGSGALNYITSLSEDRKGQIWACSWEGIDVINIEEGIISHMVTSGGLISNNTNSSLEDSQGNIWIATESGIDIIDPVKGTLKHITKAHGLSQNNVFNLLEDKRGNIWIGSYEGIDIVNAKDRTLKRFAKPGEHPNRLIKNGGDRILIRTSDGALNIVDLDKGNWKHLGKAQGISDDLIWGMVADHLGQIWLTTKNGIDIVDADKGKIKHLAADPGLGDNFIKALLIDNQDHIWMNDGYAGLYIHKLNGEVFRRLGIQQGLNTKVVTGLFQDRQARIWISAINDGILDIADPEAGTIKEINDPKGLKITAGGFLEDEKGQTWITCGDGIYIFDPVTAMFKHLNSANGLNTDMIYTLYKDKADHIWLSSDRGINVYNPLSKTFKYLTTSGGLVSNAVCSCVEDDDGNIWVETIGGIDIIDPKSGTLKHLVTAAGQRMNSVGNLQKDEKGKIWMSTTGYGLYRIDPEKRTLINFTTKEGLGSDVLSSIKEKNGSIYAGTSEGLTIVTPGSESGENPGWQVKAFGKPQLFDYVDFNPTVLLTKKNQIWWGVGADGIFTMDELKKDSIIPPVYINGIDIMEHPQTFIHKKLSQIRPGFGDSTWSVNKDTFYVKGQIPTDTGYLKTNAVRWDNINGPYNIPVNLSLPYNQNYIRFHFTGMHLGNTDKTRYRYILEGKDEKWNPVTDLSFASYINLKPGKYIFKVVSRGFNGLWSKPDEIDFTITPPWWKTWWAYILFTVTAGILVWGGITVYRSRQIKSENRRLEEKVLQRTAELHQSLETLKSTQSQLIHSEKMASLGELTAGIAHEIQNPLNFVNNFSEVNVELLNELKDGPLKKLPEAEKKAANEIVEDLSQNLQKISNHGKRADAIVKGMLQHSRSSTSAQEQTDINALADEYLRLAYHGLRAKKNSFTATIQTDFDNTIEKITIVPQDIGRVLLNLYNNAFYAVNEKNASPGSALNVYEPTVSVSTKNIGNKITISVKDNGNGIPQKVIDKIFQPFFTTKPTGQGTGLGLSLSYDIVKAHGGKIKVHTVEGEFTEFVVELPA